MQKVIFTNRPFYILLIVYISALLIYNGYVAVKWQNIYALIPIGIQLVILAVIGTKNKYSKLVILVWTIIFLMVASALKILGTLLDQDKHLFDDQNFYKFLGDIATLIISIVVISFSKTIRLTDVAGSNPSISEVA